MTEPTPPVLHRAALERVLARAAELQAASTNVPETLTEAELVSLGAEVGLSAEALKQALVEERMRVELPTESGLLATLAGPANFVATRVITGDAKAVLAKLDDAMDQTENLQVLRRFPDRIVWGPRGGFASAIRALTRLDGRGFPLARADEVSAMAVATESGRVHVRLEASLQGRRVSAAQAGSIGLISGGGLVVIALALNAMLPVALGVLAAVSGTSLYVARKNYRRDARLAQLALEQALDRLEFGEPRKKPLF